MSESFTNDNYISPPILSTLIKILATFSSNAFPVSLYTSNIQILLMYVVPGNDLIHQKRRLEVLHKKIN